MTRFDFLRRLITGAAGYLLATLTRSDEPLGKSRARGKAAALEGEPDAAVLAPGRAGTAERLIDIDGAMINVLSPDFEPRFDADGNVLNFRDVLSRVQTVLDARTRSVIVRVPGDPEYHFSGEHADGSRASIANPIVGLKFNVDGCWVESDGAVIHMSDWTQADANAAGVDSTSQDCFKLFSWRDGVLGGGTNGSFRVLGESDGSVLNTGPAPRAVASAVREGGRARLPRNAVCRESLQLHMWNVPSERPVR